MILPIADRNPTRTFPFVTLLIIAANVVAFGYQLMLPPARTEELIYALGVVPGAWTGRTNIDPAFLTFITCMFLHGGVFHLVGNMLFLWIFGDNVEDALGHLKFLLFYFATGIAGTFAHVALNPTSLVPVIGASGAISGVLGAYFLYFPRARITGVIVLIPILLMPQFEASAFFYLGLYMLLQIVNAVGGLAGPGGGVAWWAHIGGFLTGFLFAAMFARRR